MSRIFVLKTVVEGRCDGSSSKVIPDQNKNSRKQMKPALQGICGKCSGLSN